MTLTQVTKAGLHDIALDHVFTIGASGSDHYTFQGEGLNGTVNDPTLYLTRGKTYRFENGTGAHPIRIQSTSGASGTAYNTGVTNNAGSGTVIVEVQHDAPDVLYYQCTSHANMNGVLYITGALADGGVTTAKIANNAVTETKLATNAVSTGRIIDTAVTTAKIADDAVTNAKIGAGAVGSTEIATNAVTSDKINTGQVTTAKLGDLAVSTAKLGDQAVTLAKLEHGTSSNDGKFLRANNGADPTFETVSTDLVGDTSPQLGGQLQSNSQNINLEDNDKLKLGTNGDTELYHNNTDCKIENHTGDLYITNIGTNSDDVIIQSKDNLSIQVQSNEDAIVCYGNASVDLYHNDNKRIETTDNGALVQTEGDAYLTILADNDNNQSNNWPLIDFRVNNLSGTTEARIAYREDNSVLKFDIAGSEKVGINANGLVFNGDTAAANALHDYEEGAWSPKLGGTSNYSTYNIDGHGWYVKIGAIVHWALRFNAENLDNSASGGVMIYQFPYQFNRGSGVNSNVSAGLVNAAGQFYQVAFTGSQKHGWYAGNNSTILYGLVIRHATSWVDWPVSDFHSSNMYFMLSGTYRTDS